MVARRFDRVFRRMGHDYSSLRAGLMVYVVSAASAFYHGSGPCKYIHVLLYYQPPAAGHKPENIRITGTFLEVIALVALPVNILYARFS